MNASEEFSISQALYPSPALHAEDLLSVTFADQIHASLSVSRSPFMLLQANRCAVIMPGWLHERRTQLWNRHKQLTGGVAVYEKAWVEPEVL